jgi:hypothetical protein
MSRPSSVTVRVRCGSRAAVEDRARQVRSTLNCRHSGHFELVRLGAISRLMHRSQANPVRSLRPRGRARCRQIEAERLGGFQIDHQLVLGRRLHRQISRLRSGPYQRSHGPCRSGPNVSVLFVQSSDEVAGRSSPGLGLSQIGRQMPALLSFTFLDLKCGSASSRAVPPV